MGAGYGWSVLTLAVIAGCVLAMIRWREAVDVYLPEAARQVLVACVFALSIGITFVAPGRYERNLLRLLSRRRTRGLDAALRGRRSQEAIGLIVADQGRRAAAWAQFAKAAGSNIMWMSGTDTPRRLRMSVGLFMLIANDPVGRMFAPVIGVGVGQVILSLTGIGLILWGFSMRPYTRRVEGALKRRAAGCCPDCGYDLTGVPRAMDGPGAALGPRACIECEMPWPLVVPERVFWGARMKGVETE